MFARFDQLKQRGDTIVEVLIAIAVASSVLGISYATMNRNLLTIQSNQERTEASKIAQGQIEALRQIATLPAANINFCIKSDGSTQTISGAPNESASGLALDDFSRYSGECTTSNSLYHIGLTSVDQKNYRIYIRWDSIVGGGRDQIIMVYRL